MGQGHQVCEHQGGVVYLPLTFWSAFVKLPRRRFLHLAAGAAAALALPRIASALDYPTRPLTLIVSFAAGGPSDVAGRVIAQRMSEVFGQSVVVENLSGAGGTIGSAHVAKALPDGYQFVLGNSGTHVWSQSLYKQPPYNTITDFTPVSLVTESPHTLITLLAMTVIAWEFWNAPSSEARLLRRYHRASGSGRN
jgi:tripartite-type tricarboxylate transporter receptor subunit TctC